MRRLLVIDNYDSFTYNLVQMFKSYELQIMVYRSDKIALEQVCEINPQYILISPGPKDPKSAGISTQLVREFYKKVPILGVCLGMQCINEAFGGETVRAPKPVHGKAYNIIHNNQGIFKGIPTPFKVARYHSLMVRPPSNGYDLKTLAYSEDDSVIMGIMHESHPLTGVQFHPESFMTENGVGLIENFLKVQI
ncbi:MAG TPA: aminodeoxychorismate/anthranilate synthase component II [Pseudobacteroides sp.]|uniref:anthranilate synthase component II n=1 Tax=Pseudobacteroides sp. TaxID=1968840 RepID=UPI002F93A5A4